MREVEGDHAQAEQLRERVRRLERRVEVLGEEKEAVWELLMKSAEERELSSQVKLLTEMMRQEVVPSVWSVTEQQQEVM